MFCTGLTEEDTKETGKMANSMIKEPNIHLKMARQDLVNGKMAKEFNGYQRMIKLTKVRLDRYILRILKYNKLLRNWVNLNMNKYLIEAIKLKAGQWLRLRIRQSMKANG